MLFSISGGETTVLSRDGQLLCSHMMTLRNGKSEDSQKMNTAPKVVLNEAEKLCEALMEEPETNQRTLLRPRGLYEGEF